MRNERLMAILDRLCPQCEAPRAVRKHHSDALYLGSQLMFDHVKEDAK